MEPYQENIMDAELKARWVAALRSGTYAQTQNVLRNHEGFCCLGVLCDLVDPDGWQEPNGDETKFGYLDPESKGYAETYEPPVEITTRAGLYDTGIFMEMNDNLGNSFDEIADYIEANV